MYLLYFPFFLGMQIKNHKYSGVTVRMNSITVSKEKTLKLTNVLIKDIQGEELQEFQLIVEKMNNFIKVKGVQPLGPLIQYVKGVVSDEGQVEVKISLLQQTNQLIHHLEQDYRTDSLIRIKNCLYCRYIGPEEKLKFAYDNKIHRN